MTGPGSAHEAAQRLLAAHQRPAGQQEAPLTGSEHCPVCGQPWPCDVEVVATALLRAMPGPRSGP